MQETSVLPWLHGKTRQPIRVVVVGDLILDEYLEGDVNRISPEAPVPVHVVSNKQVSPGGAANTALNVQLAGGQAILLGVCGDDEAGHDIKRLLSAKSVETNHLIFDKSRLTIKKTRVHAGGHQLVRIDWEKIEPTSAEHTKQLLAALRNLTFDALLLSDYGKGGLSADFVQQAIAIANGRHAVSVIDPKGTDYHRYRGASLITPNCAEAYAALNLEKHADLSAEDLAAQLQKQFGLRNVLLTLGARGMYLLPEAGTNTTPKHLSAKAREVYDVSGAGDTVAAIMALGLGAKMSLSNSMVLANLAAGRVVGKRGTQPIYANELIEAYLEGHAANLGQSFSSAQKIKSVDELHNLLGPSLHRPKRVVFTNGCFDLLHAGHVSYLEKAKALGDILVVGINSDASVRRIKGQDRPVVKCEDRLRVIAGLGAVDYVVKFDEDTPEGLIAALMPNVLVKGADWEVDKIVGADLVKRSGGEVGNIELVPGLSTTEIMQRVRSGQGVSI